MYQIAQSLMATHANFDLFPGTRQKVVRMIFRSFSRSFYEVASETDCDNEDKTSARKIASKQSGQWNVWVYSPSTNPGMAEKSGGDGEYSLKTIIGA